MPRSFGSMPVKARYGFMSVTAAIPKVKGFSNLKFLTGGWRSSCFKKPPTVRARKRPFPITGMCQRDKKSPAINPAGLYQTCVVFLENTLETMPAAAIKAGTFTKVLTQPKKGLPFTVIVSNPRFQCDTVV